MPAKYPKFEYAYLLGSCFPSPVIDDETGFSYMDDVHETYRVFEYCADKKIEELGLSQEAFYSSFGITQVLEAYGLDKEKFWYAVSYVYWLTTIWAPYKWWKTLPSYEEQLVELRDGIKGRHEFKVILEDKIKSHTLVIGGGELINMLVTTLDSLIEDVRLQPASRPITTWRDRQRYKLTEMTWYAANLFSTLLKCLNLPVIRSRSTRKKIRTLEGGEVQVKGKDAEVSYDKNQLIAELIHFLGLTDNEDLDGYSIKGILNAKRKFEGIGCD